MPPPFITRSSTLVSARETSSYSSSIGNSGEFPPRQLERQNSYVEGQVAEIISKPMPPSTRRPGSRGTVNPLHSSSVHHRTENQEFSVGATLTDKAMEAKMREMEQLRNNARAAEFAIRGQEEVGYMSCICRSSHLSRK